MRTLWKWLLPGLAGFLLLGATCQGTSHRDPVAALLGGLAEPARRSVTEAARMLPCHGGCGHLLGECLSIHSKCVHATRELELLEALARSGANAGDLVVEATLYYQSFSGPPLAIDLSQAACKGPDSAPVTAVVFSDFECPACAGAQTLLASLVRDGGPVRLCFKYFPLDSHAHSREAAQAAESARRAGRFWELHDRLFEHQESLSLDAVVALAAEAGADAAQVRDDVASDRYLSRVNDSKAEGKALGVTGTPTVFLNGRRFTLPLDGPFLSRAVADHLEFAQGGWTHD
jgi:protein-disulfide isomerase